MATPSYKKAYTFAEIGNAVRFDVPIDANHEFFTDFSDVRGEFEEKALYQYLNVDYKTKNLNVALNAAGNKNLLFLVGNRGSGKTSELAKIAQTLNHPQGFLPVICNLDTGLDMNDMEYMDILIFQLERLFQEINKRGILPDGNIIQSLQQWFTQRVEEANRVIKKEGGFEVGIEMGNFSLLSFLKLTTKVKANLLGVKENATKIRTVFRQNFTEFATKFNEFIETVNIALRHQRIAQEVLFIVDGLEKTGTQEMRRKVVRDETNRIRQIKVNTIFTLPIELMDEQQKLRSFCYVLSFPCVKLLEKDGKAIEKAVQRFVEFTYKRIDERLFDSIDTVRRAVLMGGGSPREYLRLLQSVSINGDLDKGIIDAVALDRGISKLAAQTTHYTTKADLELLKTLKEANAKGEPIPYGQEWQRLLEESIVLEYNDGSYKRVNPIVEASELYKYHVGTV